MAGISCFKQPQGKIYYCKLDTPTYTKQRYDKYMIAQMCEVYGIEDPEIQCEMFFTEEERDQVNKILEKEGRKEIHCNRTSFKRKYTPNRKYCFKKV